MDYNCQDLPSNLPEYGLYVTNISLGETNESVQKFFSQYGEVLRVNFKKKGSADVFFKTKVDMLNALHAHNQKMNGKAIRIFISNTFLAKFHLPPDYHKNTKPDSRDYPNNSSLSMNQNWDYSSNRNFQPPLYQNGPPKPPIPPQIYQNNPPQQRIQNIHNFPQHPNQNPYLPNNQMGIPPSPAAPQHTFNPMAFNSYQNIPSTSSNPSIQNNLQHAYNPPDFQLNIPDYLHPAIIDQ